MSTTHSGMINLDRLTLYDSLLKELLQGHIQQLATTSQVGHVQLDDSLVEGSNHAVTSAAVYLAMSQKADANHDHDSRYYTQAQVDELIESATVSDQMWAQINNAINSKANATDLTAHVGDTTIHTTVEEHAKLSGIESGAQANIIETIQKNGQALTVSDKTVNITVPENVSQLANDVGYVTSTDISAQIAGKADASHTHSIADVEQLEGRLAAAFSTTTTGTKNSVVATPNGSDGYLSIRKLVVDDLPVGRGPDTVAPGVHTHDVSEILNMPIAMKTANPLNLQIEGQVFGSYDGDQEITFNVTKQALGLGNIENISDINRTVGAAMRLDSTHKFSITGGGQTPAYDFNGTQDVAMNLTAVNCRILMQDTNDWLVLDGSLADYS